MKGRISKINLKRKPRIAKENRKFICESTQFRGSSTPRQKT